MYQASISDNPSICRHIETSSKQLYCLKISNSAFCLHNEFVDFLMILGANSDYFLKHHDLNLSLSWKRVVFFEAWTVNII
jgi:hypothetical protein